MVTQFLLEPILHLVIILPLLLIFMKERTTKNYLRVLSIVGCYFIYYFALTLQYHFDCFNLINGNWNWDGKIYGIACGVAMYFIFRRQFSENNFFTFKQNKEGLKSALKVAVAILAIAILGGVVNEKEFNLETLLFQISMPGIDEEIMYRGVLLGLMCSALRTGGAAWRSPAIIINAVLFGLVHSLTLGDGALQFNSVNFIWTAILGYSFGYITIKTRSILIPMLTHNLYNFTLNLLAMI
ncbi:MAG: CPBP family intramembrane metalloprotease [Rikenellaceae bacterium]|nr:CPBP family intramembrane metalloprotease [Rikenellaceae bacterium]